jgi:hypothetical protein
MNITPFAAPNLMLREVPRPSAEFMLPKGRKRVAAIEDMRARLGSATAREQAGRTSIRGALSRVLQALIAARQARAQQVVRQHLANRSDAILLAAGYSREEIEAIRREVSSGPLAWF